MGADGSGSALRIDLLGELTLHVGHEPVEVPGVRRRTLLATLALAPRRVHSRERLIDLIWPDEPPLDALRALYNHVSRLRKHLGDAGLRLRSSEAGYALDLGDDEVDVLLARRLADHLAGQPAPRVISGAQEALSLWRGPSLAEFRAHPDLAAAAVSLDELRARLRDDLTEARLEVGDRSVVADAQLASAEQPLRERTALLTVRALAHDGRQAEAMAEAAAYRRRLAEETGLDPGPALALLEHQVAAGQLVAPPGHDARAQLPRLAAPTGPLVGRERDREEVRRLLGEHRVVTLTGAGGVGKTRLALDVAAEIGEAENLGAVFVDLATVEEPARVAQAVGSTLELRTAGEVSPEDVASALGDARLLLVLDNCEHVVEACRELVDVMAARVPGVAILSTSRIVLHARGEYVVRLQPLPIPAENVEAHRLDAQPSVRAFLEHARRRDRTFALGPHDTQPLVELLRRLDGLPLAIEIAAGHAVTMPIATVRDRLALDLASSSGSSDAARHATLRATIRWSYEMLSPTDQALLLAMAPFPGGVDLETLEHLAVRVTPGQDPLRLLHRLVDASLLEVARDRSRYRLLFMVRSFLLEELGARGDGEAAETRFVRRMLESATEIGAGLYGPDEERADRRLRAELPNLRAARDLARSRGDLDSVVDITLALDQPSIWRDLHELWAWCLELAQEPGASSHRRAVEILGAAAESARLAGAYDRSVELARQGLARNGSSPHRRARCESALAAVALYRGEFDEAAAGWLRAATEADPAYSAYLASAALASAYAGETAAARELLDRATNSAVLAGCAGNHAFAVYVDGEITALEDGHAAAPAYQAAIAEARSVGASFVAGVASVALATARTVGGDRAAAAAAFAELLEIWHRTGQAPQLWTTARNAAALLLAEGHPREATLLVTFADRSPDAAAVDEGIAEHTGRTHVAVTDTLDSQQLAAVLREADTLSVREVVEAARLALLQLAKDPQAG
ncbi:putative ATPase [metagenome]|uniref:Putative ATPase n=1 Tax=metagenome TaxID=256318 RepID=A0A2P2C2G3_9ZZZZ